VTALRRTPGTTPAVWALVAWMCWSRVPHKHIGLWLAALALVWVGNLALLNRLARRRPLAMRDSWLVLAAAGLDDAAWGAVVGLLMCYDRVLDPWLAAVLCGVSAVCAPIHITFICAYRVQVTTMWDVNVHLHRLVRTSTAARA
jgi:hypothetical protein